MVVRPKLRVLLIAEAANPEWASVPLIGWSLSQALMKCTNAHIVTQVRNREAFIRAGMIEGRDFTAIDNEYLASPLHKIAKWLRGGAGVGWTTGMAFSALAYYAFEHELWRKFKSRIKAGEFDLVHRITPLSPTNQSIIARRLARCDIPFVMGPLNGGVPWPKGFVDRQHAEKEWLSHVRGAFKLLPAYKSSRRHSSAIIVGSRHTLEQMPERAQKKCIYIPENAVDPDRFNSPRNRSVSTPLKAIFIGRLVPYKGADLLIEAAASFLKNDQLELHIVGDGPQRTLLEEMVKKMELVKHITFHGWVPHHEVQEKLRACDFMALPSIREFGGGVVIEAMALGLTPVVADYAGPSELVDNDTGFRVPFHDKQSLVEGFKQVFSKIIENPSVLDEKGAVARQCALKKYTWDVKANQILDIYHKIKTGDEYD